MPGTTNASLINGKKVLITGASGAVAAPIVQALAPTNEVHALARFRTPESRQLVRDVGAIAVPFDLTTDSFDELDDDYDIVLNFAVRRTTDDNFELELATGAEAVGLLMDHCRRARVFFHCSTTGVYRPPGDRPARETDPLGDHHGSQLPTYSIGKIAAEAVARSGARVFDLPTVIARLSVPYGRTWGWPVRQLEAIATGQPVRVHPDDPMWFNPIHERDLIAQVASLVDAAAVPATIVNWAGDEAVQIGEWCQLMGEIIGVEPVIQFSDTALRGVRVDCTKRMSITGPTTVGWRDGFEEMVVEWQAEQGRTAKT